MRGRRDHYTTTSGAKVERWRLEAWVCLAVWVYLLQGVPERKSLGDITKIWKTGGNKRGALERVSHLMGEMEKQLRRHALSEEAVRAIWKKWERYPSAFTEAEMYVIGARALHAEGRPGRRISAKILRARALAAQDALAWAEIKDTMSRQVRIPVPRE